MRRAAAVVLALFLASVAGASTLVGTMQGTLGVGTYSAAPSYATIDLTLASSTLAYALRTNSTLNKPTGTVDGDFLLAALYVEAEALAITPPAGWALLTADNNTGAGDFKVQTYYKVASGEGASWQWTHSSTNCSGFAWRITGVTAAGNPLDCAKTMRAGSGTSITWDSITTATPGAAVIGVRGHYDGGSRMSATTLTERIDTDDIGAVGDTQGSAGPSGAKTGTDSVNSQWMCILFALTPATL